MTDNHSIEAVPWLPPSLEAHQFTAADAAAYDYVLLEEIAGRTAELERWPWPGADTHGRLVWPEPAFDQMRSCAVPVDLLLQQLYRPNQLLRRPRPGDTFACRTVPAGWSREPTRPITDLTDLLVAPLYDISADARQAAKLAYLGATGAIAPEWLASNEPGAGELGAADPAPSSS